MKKLKQYLLNCKIQKKFILILTTASLGALLMVSITILLYENYTFKPRTLRDINTQADIIKEHLDVAINFNDSLSASESLSAFLTNKDILLALVLDKNNKIFASLGNTPVQPGDYLTQGKEYHFRANHLTLKKAIDSSGETLGYLYIELALPSLTKRLAKYSPFFIVIIFALTTIILITASGANFFIIQPMQSLTRVANKISELSDYRIRSTIHSNDELGILSDTLNKLLSATENHQNNLLAINAALSLKNMEVEKQRNLAELAKSKFHTLMKSHESLLNYANEGIIEIDKSGSIIFCNPKAAELLESDEESLLASNIAHHFGIFFHNRKIDVLGRWRESRLNKTLIKGLSHRVEDEIWHSSKGSPFHIGYSFSPILNEQNESTRGVLIFEDISTRKNNEIKMAELANFDPLTSLANRRYFYEAIVLSLARAQRANSQLALLYIDVDNFKQINDSHGHEIGDKVLVAVAMTLKNSIRIDDIVSRLSGDEFAVLLHDLDSPAFAQNIAQKITSNFKEAKKIDGYEIILSVSIGISMHPGSGKNAEELLRAADAAMYEVKKSGRCGIQFFEEKLQREAENRNRIISGLNSALHEHEFHLVYQPKYCLKEKKMVGAEALLRWELNGELVPPDIFIPIAERSGSISAIGEWVLVTLCKQLSRWRKENKFAKSIRISINVSPRQLYSGEFSKKVKQALKSFHLAPNALEIEITETTILNNPELVISELNNIRRAGVKISIDDFGTGYSSLSYLKRLPIDLLKIDKTFTMDIGKNKNDETIVLAVIALAHSLNMEVVAEGVETLQQLAFLQDNHCDQVQGYYLSKPLNTQDFANLLHNKGENADVIYGFEQIQYNSLKQHHAERSRPRKSP